MNYYSIHQIFQHYILKFTMKSFQNKTKDFRSLQSRKCIHGRRSLQYFRNVHAQKKNQHSVRQVKQNTHIAHEKDDAHSKMIKSLVAMNQEYFQNKLQVANDGRPSKLKLKIPSHTGFTIYKRDYIKNQGRNSKAHDTSPSFKQNKIKADFFDGTTYRNQFTGNQNSEPRHKQQPQQHVNTEAPTFHESQYKHNYLNWGASSFMPSMKPHPNPAVTNLPFQTTTVYSSQFTNKPSMKKQNFKPTCSAVLSNSGIKPNQMTSSLLYMTTNNMFFDKKNNAKQGNLKLKTHTLAVSGNYFKGKTEYQSQFIKSKASGNFQASPKKPLAELQNLILDL